ncbi:hypothetical protein K466DRAFT_586178 [Polyporus arcularius HHB13444]|uniref:F-box domain-containing protein n=1 Tax=Polyporus arcularius HHB13444 TaxID=1314778 RepID=A0A5C3PD38_9APHY|nr:hypothetical protein K466DRAFT_586178 [Polyporus arcularius HHB13444]
MPPTTSGIAPQLPVELLRHICDAADRGDLYSIALSSATLNDVATPVLYSAIDLQVFHAIYLCVRSLASAPARNAMERDLAGFVETLSLRDPDLWAGMSIFDGKLLSVIRRRLAHALPRMQRLRSITYRIGMTAVVPLFTTLTSGVFRCINEIDLELYYPYALMGAQQANSEVTPVGVRGLTTLKLYWSGDAYRETYQSFMCSLLAANHRTLRRLTALPDDGPLQSALQSISSFPALEELEAPPAILSQPAFQDTSSIRRFVVPTWWNSVDLPSTALPNLQEVACTPEQLEEFLPEHAEHRRPINTVMLNQVRYERTRSGGEYVMEELEVAHGWYHDICPALRSLRFSGAPLVRLGVAANRLSVGGLSDLMPLIKNLEYLLISVQSSPGEDEISDVAPLLGRMPRLHTFLLSDGLARSFAHGCPFEFYDDEDYQRAALDNYDQHSSSLRRVAFTTEFEWEKREDGWHPWGHIVADREIVSDGEDEGADEEQGNS